MTLKQYHAKRHFARTTEPRGKVITRAGRRYVIQKHDASHLHYDFRLELHGVLLSWAVPKGPSLDPHEKRLAVHVEDHPLDYADFEGTIPAGQYGGGTVMVWDRGTWQPDGDAAKDYRRGRLSFQLHGEKLRGGWSLVRMGRPARNGKENWLLIKSRDSDARSSRRNDLLLKDARSVKSGRTMEEIAAGGSPRSVKKKSTATRVRKPSLSTKRTITAATKPASMPLHPAAQLATLTTEPPDGDEWLHEVKFDGYRIFALIKNGKVRFRSRNDHDWTRRLVGLRDAVAGLPVRQAVFDGEVTALDEKGGSRFQLLQNALSDESGSTPLVYYLFDILHLDGRDLTSQPLEARKAVLQELLPSGKKPGQVRYSDHVIGNGTKLFRQACRSHWEGIISKRRIAPYRAGRSRDWLKIKCGHEQELVIAGFTDPGGSRSGFGSLLLGYYDDSHQLVYAGRVGTGFSEKTLHDLTSQLKRIELSRSPFSDSSRPRPGRGIHWVKPIKVAQIRFAEWTRDGLLRQPAFLGLRLDKPAAEIVREVPNRKPRR